MNLFILALLFFCNFSLVATEKLVYVYSNNGTDVILVLSGKDQYYIEMIKQKSLDMIESRPLSYGRFSMKHDSLFLKERNGCVMTFQKKDDCIIPIRTYVGLKQMKFVFQKYGSISESEPKDVLETCTRDMSQELIPLRFGAYYTASGLKIVIHPDNRYELSISETRLVFPGNGMKPYEKEFITGYSRGKWFREHNILYFQDLDMECVFSADIKSFAIDNITMPLAEDWRFDLKRED